MHHPAGIGRVVLGLALTTAVPSAAQRVDVRLSPHIGWMAFGSGFVDRSVTILPGDTTWTTVTARDLAPALVLGGALEVGAAGWTVAAEYRSARTRSHLTSSSVRPTDPYLSGFVILDRHVRQASGALSVARRIALPSRGIVLAPSIGWEETRTHWSGIRFTADHRTSIRYASRGPLLALAIEHEVLPHLVARTRLASAFERTDARPYSRDLQETTIQLLSLSPHWMIRTSLDAGASLRW